MLEKKRIKLWSLTVSMTMCLFSPGSVFILKCKCFYRWCIFVHARQSITVAGGLTTEREEKEKKKGICRLFVRSVWDEKNLFADSIRFPLQLNTLVGTSV